MTKEEKRKLTKAMKALLDDIMFEYELERGIAIGIKQCLKIVKGIKCK